MATDRIGERRELVVRAGEPLIGIPDEIDGEEVTRYFASDEDADAAMSEDSLHDALSLAGGWSHLDWEETLGELERIRRESTPTPPIEFDE